MHRGTWMMGAVLLTIAGLGCTSSSTSDSAHSSAETDGGSTARTSTADASQGSTPDGTVREFLTSVRAGDDSLASSLLTDVAREETSKRQLAVAPPGSDSATFEVGEVELVEPDGAHVASTWTDVGDDGQPHTDDIVWMLRKEPQGWRIAGMATILFQGEPPLLLNFEDPDDMLRKQRLAEREIARRGEPGADAVEGEAPSSEPEARTKPPVDTRSLKKRYQTTIWNGSPISQVSGCWYRERQRAARPTSPQGAPDAKSPALAGGFALNASWHKQLACDRYST